VPDTLLKLDDLVCRYGELTAVDGLSLRLRRGEIGCLLGPSGCGKTTVLRAVAGFEPVCSGAIQLDGREIASPVRGLPPDRRGIGMVFQDYALFPHLSVGHNVAFGLRGLPRRERRAVAARLLDLVGLGGLDDRYPHELSGGQQQRVAVARAVAPRPRLVLMDEPFSNLDVDLRERLGSDIHRLLKDQGIAALFVTHDQHEAFLIGDRIGVMKDGRLLQWDSAFALYHQPADRFVADFIGQGRLISGVMSAPDAIETALGVIRGNVAYAWPAGRRVALLLRPDDVVPDPAGPVEGEVVGRAFKGAETLYTLRVGTETEILCEVPSRLDYPVGARLRVRAEVEHLIVFAD
jgi:iron(III) transport system ATP-binding protein